MNGITKVMRSRKAGSLHKALGVPAGQKIPRARLEWAIQHLDRAQAARAALVLRIHFKK